MRHGSAVAASIRRTLCPAEGPVDALIGRRRIGIGREHRLLLVRRGEDCHQFVEGREILPRRGRLYDGLDSMIARDETRIRTSHCGLTHSAMLRFSVEAETPLNSPLIVGARILEEAPHGFVSTPRANACYQVETQATTLDISRTWVNLLKESIRRFFATA